jgi:hypothetical protein
MQITGRHPEKADAAQLEKLINIMGDLLETLPEFSMNVTLEKMQKQGKLNSHAELTLKGNAENSYCRSYIFELYRGIYEPEIRCVRKHLEQLAAGEYPDKDYLLEQFALIQNAFYDTPLVSYRSGTKKSSAGFLRSLPGLLS